MAKVKVPKRVGGVKLPKKVRKRANKALELAGSPIVREFATAAMGAAAETKLRQRERADDSPEFAVSIDGDKLVEAIRSAALDGLTRFLEGFEEGLREATKVVAEETAKARSRRGASGRSEAAGD